MNTNIYKKKLNLNKFLLFTILILLLIINSIFQLNSLLNNNQFKNLIGSNMDNIENYKTFIIIFSIISQIIIAIITIIFDLLLIFIITKFLCKSKNTLGNLLIVILIGNIGSILANIIQSILFKDIFIQNINNILVFLPSNILKIVLILYLLVKYNFINKKIINCLIIGISYSFITFLSYFIMIKML